MPRPRLAPTAPRKAPVQARSTQLVKDILAAAIRVLEREGASRFTTIRVAEAAGVSVGSLYQYFPNKQAILFRLQVDEWEATGATIATLLGDGSLAPAERLRAMLRAFFQSECDEAPFRLALDALAPSYRDAPEARALHRRSRRTVAAFVAESAPHANDAQQRFAVDLLLATMTAIGKQVSELEPSRARVEIWADEVAAMLVGYLARLGGPPLGDLTKPSTRARRPAKSARFTRA